MPSASDAETVKRTPSGRGRRVILHVLFLVALVLFAVPMPSSHAGTLELGNLILDNQAGNITVRFGVRVEDIETLEAVLDEGTVVGLVCESGVSRRKRMWPDAEIASARWESTLSRDVLARDYVLILPGTEKPLRSRDLRTLLDEAWGRLSMVVGPWASLSPGNEYSLDLNISLARRDVPVWLRYVVFFKSWDVLPPVSYQLDFSY